MMNCVDFRVMICSHKHNIADMFPTTFINGHQCPYTIYMYPVPSVYVETVVLVQKKALDDIIEADISLNTFDILPQS